MVDPSELPSSQWLMALPFAVSLALGALVLARTRNWFKLISVVPIVLGLLLTLTLINIFYNFYPTLYSVFSADTRQILARESAGLTTIQYNANRLRADHLRVKYYA